MNDRITDLEVQCVGLSRDVNDCGKMFKLTASEQIFFKTRSLNLPKRCPDCRRKKKERALSEEESRNAV